MVKEKCYCDERKKYLKRVFIYISLFSVNTIISITILQKNILLYKF